MGGVFVWEVLNANLCYWQEMTVQKCLRFDMSSSGMLLLCQETFRYVVRNTARHRYGISTC